MIDLKADHISKRYTVGQESGGDSARHPLVRKLQSLRRRGQEFWAVRDVSFEVRHGEALGIIGHNGAGKSTLLKLLSSITAPTSGEITINGHLSALIEVGSGFHPELSGRENIYLSGSILGMRRREITEKLDDIIDFAGVRHFIDTPVKRYSSGMYVRLGFSIAAHLDPEILLLDEVLAVGDTAFQERCIKRINDLKRAGTTIIFISHDLGAVERLCDRVLLMQRGEVIADGPPREVIAEYQRTASQISTPATSGPYAGATSKQAEITFLAFYDAAGQETTVFRTGDPVTASVQYEVREPVFDAVIEALIYSADGELSCHLTSRLSNGRIDLSPGTGKVELFCDELGLQPGLYYVNTEIWQQGAPGHDGATQLVDSQSRRAMLRVDPGKIVHGSFYMPHEWRFVREGEATNAERVRERAVIERR